MIDFPENIRRVRIIQIPRDGWWRIEYTSGLFGSTSEDWKYYASRATEKDALQVAKGLKYPNVMEIK